MTDAPHIAAPTKWTMPAAAFHSVSTAGGHWTESCSLRPAGCRLAFPPAGRRRTGLDYASSHAGSDSPPGLLASRKSEINTRSQPCLSASPAGPITEPHGPHKANYSSGDRKGDCCAHIKFNKRIDKAAPGEQSPYGKKRELGVF